MVGTRTVDLIKQLTEQMQVFGVSVQKNNLLSEQKWSLDGGLRERIFSEFDYGKGICYAREYCVENTIYVLSDIFECHYICFMLPSEDVQCPPCEMMWIGPALTESWEVAMEGFLKKHSLSPYQENELKEYYSKVPLIREWEFFESLVFLQIGYICGENEKVEVCRIGDFYGQSMEFKELQKAEEYAVSAESVELRYRQEKELMDAVAAGDTERAIAAQKKFLQFHMEGQGQYATLRNAKNKMVVFNTLLRKAVQAAEVHPMHIDKISGSYARKIEESIFVKDLRSLSYEMIRKYCLLVRNHSLGDYSPVVRNAINYINFHLKEPLSLKLLSEVGSVNASYLSAKFKKEVGRTVVDYINEKRVYSSLLYLTATELSIAEVAEQVGIGDENYYARLFKKYQNRTPSQYRTLMREKS